MTRQKSGKQETDLQQCNGTHQEGSIFAGHLSANFQTREFERV